MLGHHNSIAMGPATEYAKEMRKWEAFPSVFGPGERPYQFREYPKRMYRCEYVQGKGIDIVESHDVGDIHEERNLLSRGFSSTLQEAHDVAQAAITEAATLAAERNFEIAHGRLSEKAAAEVRAVEAEAGAVHVPMIPETPIRRDPGRPPKDRA